MLDPPRCAGQRETDRLHSVMQPGSSQERQGTTVHRTIDLVWTVRVTLHETEEYLRCMLKFYH